ncbi:MAG TPA: FixH family protein [Xanthomonadales bacterium]|nr:FixH family protein [Xanthomonadales bacterium]
MTVQQNRPWYREPWPWVLIAIPLLTVIACGVTLWLALSHPDYLVVEPQELQQIKADLNARPPTDASTAAEAPDGDDGDH